MHHSVDELSRHYFILLEPPELLASFNRPFITSPPFSAHAILRPFSLIASILPRFQYTFILSISSFRTSICRHQPAIPYIISRYKHCAIKAALSRRDRLPVDTYAIAPSRANFTPRYRYFTTPSATREAGHAARLIRATALVSLLATHASLFPRRHY